MKTAMKFGNHIVIIDHTNKSIIWYTNNQRMFTANGKREFTRTLKLARAMRGF